MVVRQRLVQLTNDVLVVEAGATVETSLVIGGDPEVPSGLVEEWAIEVQGLPRKWYTLSTERLRLAANENREVLLVIHPPHEDPHAPLGTYDFVVRLIPTAGQALIDLPARLDALPPGARTMRSRLLEYLPAAYRDDLFLARFLLIFQSILDPIEHTIDNTHNYFDPSLVPARLLPWLASWVDLTLEPELDEATQRELLHRAVALYRWKGTRRGLREELQMRTGARVLIVENFDGMRLGQDAALGLNTQLGQPLDGSMSVTFAQSDERLLDPRRADALVEELKPAHVGHVLRIVRAPGERSKDFSGGNRG